MIRIFAIVILLVSSFFAVLAQTTSVQWKKLGQIVLLGSDGKQMQIPPYKQTVFVMLSPDCPLCRNYIQVLNELQKSYPEVSFYGIFPGAAYSVAEINQFKAEYKPNFMLAIDVQRRLSSYLEATITPECIFINEPGIIKYRGLIDNWPSSLGQQRKVITQKYLAIALKQSKFKQPFTPVQTKPIGCLINDL